MRSLLVPEVHSIPLWIDLPVLVVAGAALLVAGRPASAAVRRTDRPLSAASEGAWLPPPEDGGATMPYDAPEGLY